MPIYERCHRRYRQSSLPRTVLGLAVLLGGCAATSSQPPSPGRISISPRPTASESATTTAAESAIATPVTSIEVATVTIRNRSFGTPEITVAVGTVRFVNADTVPHTVTEGENGVAAPNARFDVLVPAGESIQVAFSEPGDYRITCLFHSEMHLLVHAR